MAKKTKEGEIVLLTSGCYSGYDVVGVYRVLRPFVFASLARTYLASVHSDFDGKPRFAPGLYLQWGDDGSKRPKFAEWLEGEGWIETVDFREVNLGSYGLLPEEIEAE